MKTSSYSGFFKLSTEERLREVAEFAGLDEKETAILGSADSLDDDKADHLSLIHILFVPRRLFVHRSVR